MNPSTLFVGLGSAHGDDQVGWLVADGLAGDVSPTLQVRRAAAPADILDWLEADVAALIVCDACRGNEPLGTIHNWSWPCAAIRSAQFVGTHNLALPAVLELAGCIRALPADVSIWSVEIGDCSPGAEVSPAVRQALPRITAQIREELLRA